MGTKVRDLQGGYEPLDRRGYENVEKNGYQPQASAVKPTPPQGGTGAVMPLNGCGTTESVKCSKLLGLESVNFSENTSWMSFCISGGSGELVMLTWPWLMLICWPA